MSSASMVQLAQLALCPWATFPSGMTALPSKEIPCRTGCRLCWSSHTGYASSDPPMVTMQRHLLPSRYSDGLNEDRHLVPPRAHVRVL